MMRLNLVIGAFLLVLSTLVITHVVEFPGSVAYLREVTQDQKMLDMQPSFSTEETYQRLTGFGELGRKMYMRTILTVDMIFPVTVFLFLFIWAKFASQRVGLRAHFYKVLLSISIAYLVLDFLENASILIMLSKFPARLDFLATYVGYLTVGKRIAMISGLFIPAAILLFAKASRFFKRKHDENKEVERTAPIS